MIAGVTRETCAYFSPNPREPSIGGQCRANPPVVVVAEDRVRKAWPMVDINAWCGHHATEEPK